MIFFPFAACSAISNGIVALFGPSDPILGPHIQSLCDAMDIPHIESRADSVDTSAEISLNLYPDHTILGNAMRQLIDYLNWTKIAIIYEDDEGKQ